MKKSLIAVVLGLAGVAAAGWYVYRGQAPAAPASQAGAAPGARGASRPGGSAPISVSTVKAVQRDQRVTFEATGTVSSLNTVDIKPQVSSTVEKVHVKEGQFVRRGDLLFTLDNRADAVSVTRARAQLARDQAAFADAQRQLARSRDLLSQQFVSQSAVDAARTQVETQQAVVAASRAAVAAAELQLGYHRIAAPSAGRVGAINVFPGSLVQPSGPALLTVTQLDPIAVTFNLPQRNLDETLKGLRQGGLPVTVQLPEKSDGSASAKLEGRLQFVDSAVDPASGSVRVKAVFDNPQQQLWPGAYVTVDIVLRTLRDAIVIPQAAIVTGQRGRSVFVVDAEDKVQARPVELVHPVGPEAVVTGLRAGERIVVDGRENVRAGSKVVERGARAAGAGRRRQCSRSRRCASVGCGRSDAMNLSELFIRRPVMTVLLNVAIIVAGLIAYNRIPVAALPSYNTPVINVSASLPGASPESMASSVALPLEKQFQTIPGLNLISSTSTLGSTSVTLEFAEDRDIDEAAVDVQAALLRAQRSLPIEMTSPPSYRKVNPADAPILFLALTSPSMSPSDLNDYAEHLIQPALSTLEGIAQVNVNGSKRFAVRIQVDPQALAARNISLDELSAALRSANANTPVGTLEGARQTLTLTANRQLANAREFGDLIVSNRGGSPVRLRDVANVVDSYESLKSACRPERAKRHLPVGAAAAGCQHGPGGGRHQGAAARLP